MKIIHVCQKDDPATGGAVRVAFELVKRLITHNIDARLLFLYGDSGYFGKNLASHCDYLGLNNSRDVWLYPRFNQYLAKAKPDIVHHHDDLLWPQLLTLNHASYKKIIHSHSSRVANPSSLKIRLLYNCHRFTSNWIVCITKEVQTTQCLNVGFDCNKTSIIYNGVDLQHYQAPSADDKIESRQQLNLPLNKTIIGFVGRLDNKMKGGDDFLRVIAQLPPCYHGLVVGQGPDINNLQTLAKELKISERVYFTGLLTDPKLAYQAMDIFAFTSRFEPFGLTMLEALASNVPIVGFRCPGGSVEILTDETGIVIDERDIKAMAKAIELIASNPDNVQQKLTQGRHLLKTQFNWDISVEKLIDLYQKIST
ncbi:MAG: glycosyltransferase family 4 protein [Snowella sp.]|nr:glycosyltransferase family 4 protein [Snowella sp.]